MRFKDLVTLQSGNASYEWQDDEGACCVLGGGKGELKERKLLHRGKKFDPIDVLQKAVQLKPKPSNMSDFVNYSKHQLLTPRQKKGGTYGLP